MGGSKTPPSAPATARGPAPEHGGILAHVISAVTSTFLKQDRLVGLTLQMGSEGQGRGGKAEACSWERRSQALHTRLLRFAWPPSLQASSRPNSDQIRSTPACNSPKASLSHTQPQLCARRDFPHPPARAPPHPLQPRRHPCCSWSTCACSCLGDLALLSPHAWHTGHMSLALLYPSPSDGSSSGTSRGSCSWVPPGPLSTPGSLARKHPPLSAGNLLCPPEPASPAGGGKAPGAPPTMTCSNWCLTA